jgi:hypothetical protein
MMLHSFCRSSLVQIRLISFLLLIFTSSYNCKIAVAQANEIIITSPTGSDLIDHPLGEAPSSKELKPVDELLKSPDCPKSSADNLFYQSNRDTDSESCIESVAKHDETTNLIESATLELSLPHKISQNSPSPPDKTNPLDGVVAPETHQITTTLTGQAILAINGGGFSGDRIVAPRGAIVSRNQPNITSLYRVSLDLDTRFSKTDLLKLRFVSASPGIGDNAAGFLEPNLGSVLDFAIPGKEQVSLARLYYTFAPTNDLNVTVGSQMVAGDFVDKNRYSNASFRDFSTAALTNNFILLPRPGGAGAAINWNPNQGSLSLRGVYIASSAAASLPENQQFFGGGAANDIRLFPTTGGGSTGGLFGDPYMGVVELEYAPTKSLALRLQYSGGELLGSNFQVIGANAELAITPNVGLFARYGSGSYPGTTVGNIHPQYWSAGIAFQDIFTKNDLAGIGIAQPLILGEVGNATQTNFEAFYNIPINKNVRITPIVQVISNPANQSSNATITTGTIRTVFSF